MKKFLLLLILPYLAACSEEVGEPVAVIPKVTSETLALDPMKLSPLTAVLDIKTDVATNATITIKGQDGEDIKHTFEGFSTSHTIPVLGLYPGYDNKVELELVSMSGGKVEFVKTVKTPPLPDWIEIKQFTPVMPDAAKVGSGFVFMHLMGTNGLLGRSGCCPLMIDKFGKIRWIYYGDVNHVFKKLSNGHYLVDGNGTGFWEIDLSGAKHGYWATPEGIHHDAAETLDHTILFLSKAEGSIDDAVIELSRKDGSYPNKWDFRNILDMNRPQAPTNGLPEDWLHLNGIDYQEKDDSFIVSGRNQSVVAKIDRSSGKLKWILGNHEHWNESLNKHLLTPKGDGFEWQWGQHAPIFNPKDPSKILLFDNGCDRSYTDPIPALQNYSRVVEYRIDETAMTVEQVWQFGKEYGSELYSTYISNACYLENGNVLMCCGGLTKDSNGNAVELDNSDVCNSVRVLEIDSQTKEVVWDLKLEGKSDPKLGYRSYRAYKINIYD